MRVIELLNPIKSMKVDEGTYPYLEISDIDVASKKYSFKDKTSVLGAVYAYLNNILVSTVRPTRGAITVVNDEKIAVSNAFAILNVNDKICLPKYLFYSLKSKVFLDYLGKNSKGATYPTCSKEDVYNYDIKYVEYTKQIDIVTVLNNVSRQIEIKREQLLEYDQLIKSRFVEMFGDPILNQKGWKTEKLQNVCQVNKYKGEVENTNGKVWLLNLDMVESNTGKIINYVYEDEKNIASSTIKFDTNCVLYSKLRPYLNKVVVPLKSGYATSEMISMKTDNVSKYFLSNLLMMNSFVDFANGTSYGAKMPRASVDMIKNFDLIVPPINMQNEFSLFVEQVDKLKFEVQKSLNETQMLFDSLMQEYFG